MFTYEVKLDFCIDDGPAPFRAMVERLGNIVADTSQAAIWKIDLSKCQYLGPSAVATLAGIVLNARKRGQIVKFDWPQSPAQLRNYCHYSGLVKLVEMTPDPVRPDTQSETVPLQVFSQATVTAHLPITKLIERHVHPAEDFGFVLGTCLSEVMQNVQDHSESSFGGVASARFFVSAGEVRIAVVDQGIGIRSSIRAAHPHVLSTIDALRAVIRGGVSAQSRPNNLGLGLSNLCAMIRHAGGRVMIATGDVVAAMNPRGTWSFQTIRSFFEGTGVFFTLPVV